MTLHFPDQVETNILTIDAVDPKSGTAEFKASAIRVEKISDEDVKRVRDVKESHGLVGTR
jgi:formate dehydrogenase major subunit